MKPFITQLPFAVDVAQVATDLEYILANYTSWDPGNQIGLRHRPGAENTWKDAIGSLTKNGVNVAYERDFNTWNDLLPAYTRSILEQLATSEGLVWGRVRFMRSVSKTGLSMHIDPEQRYHLAIETNPSAIFAECYKDMAVRCTGYHLPKDSHWYRVDTTREHFVYNGGWTARVHLVADPA